MNRLTRWFVCALLGYGLSAMAELPLKNSFQFDNKNPLTPYPASEAKKFALDAAQYDGHGSLKITHSGSRSTIYSGFAFDQAPGEVEVTLNCRCEGNAKLELRLNFNQAGGRNGSAGTNAFEVALTPDWSKQSFHCVVPADAVSVQFVFTVSGEDSTLWLNNLAFGYAPDVVKFPVSSGKLTLAADLNAPEWNLQTALSGFYNLGTLANDRTVCWLAVSPQGLFAAFQNTGKPVKAQFGPADRDASLWQDDCNEIFLHNSASGNGWHFIVNSKGALFDGRLYQKQAGDPWQTDIRWNASGVKVLAKTTPDGWESRIFIPWSDLAISLDQPLELGLNLCRENKSAKIDSQWNAVEAAFGNPAGFSRLVIANGNVTVTRNRKTSSIVYTVERKQPEFESLLEKGVPGNYFVTAWSHGFDQQGFPAEWLATEAGQADFARWQKALMKCWGEVGMFGPAFPWVQNNLIGKGDELLRLNKVYGMKFLHSILNSSYERLARTKGAKYILARESVKVSPTDPVLKEVLIDAIRDLPQQSFFPLMQNRIGFIMGIDEPFNAYPEIFSKTLNKDNQTALDELDRLIRTRYGFGKFGLPDAFQEEDANLPFKRIAFNRWQNDAFLENSKVFKAELNKVLPNVPYMMTTNNCCSGLAPMDYALYNGYADIMSCDPYPTSATYVYGNERALYHTGFSTKLESDLTPDAKTLVMPQNFIYCGGKPTVASTVEWASQAMKNGAEGLMWYCAKASMDIPDCYRTMLAINKLVHRMDRIKFPERSESAILFSVYDQYALDDGVQNANYSVYSILGEHVGTSFTFVSPSALERGFRKLSDYKLVYVPKLTYTTPELTAQLQSYVEAGGTLIVFDPRFLSWNIDGTKVEGLAAFTGVGKRTPRKAEKSLQWNGKDLAIQPNIYVKLPTGMEQECYRFDDVTGKVFATYSDGTPAAVETKHGKGRLIVFAAQPFGNAELAVRPGNWEEFFRTLAKQTQQPVDLPIWRFQIPETALEKVELIPFSKK